MRHVIFEIKSFYAVEFKLITFIFNCVPVASLCLWCYLLDPDTSISCHGDHVVISCFQCYVPLSKIDLHSLYDTLQYFIFMIKMLLALS